MKLKRISKYAALAAPVIGLVACSGSEVTHQFTGPINPGNGLPFAQDGLILNIANAPAILDREFEANAADATWSGTSSSSASGTASFTILSNTVIQMTRGGDTWTFRNQGPDPLDPDRDLWLSDATDGDGPTTLNAIFGQGSAENAATTATELQSIFFGEIRTPPSIQTGVTDFASDTFAISGFETIPSEVAALTASANYQGEAQLVARTGPNDATAGQLLDGTFDIDIDFAAANRPVSGTISGDTDAEFGNGDIVLTLDPGGTIVDEENTFSTSFSKTGGSNTAITGFSGTTITGTLYGADAKEVGLLITGNATISGTGTVVTTGFGRGNKQ